MFPLYRIPATARNDLANRRISSSVGGTPSICIQTQAFTVWHFPFCRCIMLVASLPYPLTQNTVAYLLEPGTVEPEKQPFLLNCSVNTFPLQRIRMQQCRYRWKRCCLLGPCKGVISKTIGETEPVGPWVFIQHIQTGPLYQMGSLVRHPRAAPSRDYRFLQGNIWS
jgi:hypothetical protein